MEFGHSCQFNLLCSHIGGKAWLVGGFHLWKRKTGMFNSENQVYKGRICQRQLDILSFQWLCHHL